VTALAIGALALAVCEGGRSSRAEQVLQDLEPDVHLGDRLVATRAALPGVPVLASDATIRETLAADSATHDTLAVRPAAMVVSPRPATGQPAADTALVTGFVFATAPRVADSLAVHVAELFQKRGVQTCARIAPVGRDTVLLWDAHGRGGVAISFPDHRRERPAAQSFLVVYGGKWEPERLFAGYAPASCAVLRDGRR
jgi:hypothetical protein